MRIARAEEAFGSLPPTQDGAPEEEAKSRRWVEADGLDLGVVADARGAVLPDGDVLEQQIVLDGDRDQGDRFREIAIELSDAHSNHDVGAGRC